VAGCLAALLGSLVAAATLESRSDAATVASCDGHRAEAATPHDFNGDGYADLAVGAAFRTVGGKEWAGGVYVIDGSSRGLRAGHSRLITMDTTGIKGRAGAQKYFGQSVASADWDADGYADLAVRAQGDVLVIYGSRGGLSTRDQWIDLRKLGSGYLGLNGPSTATGDFDADGYPDLVIGAGFGEEEKGEVMVLRGTAWGLATGSPAYFGRATEGVPGGAFVDDHFGIEMAAGDITGDGYDDLVLTSEEETGSSLYLFRGSPAGIRASRNDRFRHEQLFGAGRPVYLGESSLAVADFNSDRYADVAIGLPASGGRDGDWHGAVVVLRGSASGLDRRSPQWWDQNSAGVPDTGETDDAFGSDIAAGDLNGDGRPDLAITVPFEDLGGKHDAGAVAVLYGNRDGLASQGSQLWSQATKGVKGRAGVDETFGYGPIRIINYGRGRSDDLVVHSPTDLDSKGSVNLLYGSTRGVSTLDQIWHGNSPDLAGRTRAATGFGDR
jgi:hypothetical protein